MKPYTTICVKPQKGNFFGYISPIFANLKGLYFVNFNIINKVVRSHINKLSYFDFIYVFVRYMYFTYYKFKLKVKHKCIRVRLLRAQLFICACHLQVYLSHGHMSIDSSDGKVDVNAIAAIASDMVNGILAQAINDIQDTTTDLRKQIKLILFDPNCDSGQMDAIAVQEISNFIDQWSLTRYQWKYLVKICRHWTDEDGNNMETFVYKATFSIPTKMQPIPQATASVYFVFDVADRSKHSDDHIYVTYRYQFEGSTFFYEANCQRFHFQENVLVSILNNKLDMFRKFDF